VIIKFGYAGTPVRALEREIRAVRECQSAACPLCAYPPIAIAPDDETAAQALLYPRKQRLTSARMRLIADDLFGLIYSNKKLKVADISEQRSTSIFNHPSQNGWSRSLPGFFSYEDFERVLGTGANPKQLGGRGVIIASYYPLEATLQ
jgi:hypothetical protein